jgi:ABC-2 type transport system ATP-binding protein
VIAISSMSLVLGGSRLVEDLTLVVEPGTIVGIGGDNGVGKSTLLRVIAGLVRPGEGSVSVFGHPPHSLESRSRTGAAIDTPAFYSWMSGRGFLRTMQNLAGHPDRGEAADALRRFGLGHADHKRIFRYSQGMKKRLSLAAASLRSPDLLLLDEPTNALDPDGQELVWTWLRGERDAGRTVLFVSHRQVDRDFCDSWYELSASGLDRG